MSPSDSPFKIGAQPPHKPKDPESLFADLHPTDENVKHLWAHQADVLRAYSKNHEKTSDVALELPTGMGKTLVGLILAEYRRQKYDERVAYLCPTRQLAYQVGRQAASYGIHTVVLVGPQNAYPPKDYASYATGEAIAVTTYSGIFNVNPRLDDARAILLDDAHAGGDYIANHWSLEIRRNHPAYSGLVELFADTIPLALLMRFREDSIDPVYRKEVHKVSSFAYFDRLRGVSEFLEDKLAGTKQSYPWSVLREHLAATHIYFSWNGVLVRPTLPPSIHHRAFANAQQRIYMSATLGVGGELERLIGVRRIARIPVPENWESQRVGRRFILLPDLALSQKEVGAFVARVVEIRDRTLVLCPSLTQALSFAHFLGGSTSVKTLDADAIEESLEPFAKADHAALVLAARYDGIDLPDNSCRQLILFGLPSALNLQEKFFVERLRVELVLRDRIRTRITQAIGRCTRNPRDYAAVLMCDTDLMEFCLRRENTSEMPCELQAELLFGIDNSRVDNPEQLLTLLQVFFAQDERWKQADAAIRDERDQCQQLRDPLAGVLMDAAPGEVDYQYAIWDGDPHRALELARGVADRLAGPEFSNYRAWWLYLASAAAYLAVITAGDQNARTLSEDLLRRAKTASGNTWTRSLLPTVLQAPTAISEDLALAAAEGAANSLRDMGFYGLKFERVIKSLLENINSDDPPRFESAVQQLGALLGFDASKPQGDGKPDVLWLLRPMLTVAFEAKSQVASTAPISVATARQCAGHAGTVRELLKLGRGESCTVVVLCHKLEISREAVPQVGETKAFLIADLRQLGQEVANTLRRVRAKADERIDLVELVRREYAVAKLDPKTVVDRLSKVSGTALKVIG